MNYEEGPHQPRNPWLPPTGPPVANDWVVGDGAQRAIAVVLDAGPWLLLAFAVGLDGPRWLIVVAGALAVLACISLAVGAITKTSLAMRMAGWPVAPNRPRTEFGAAWIELFLLFIIVFASRATVYFGADLTMQLAGVASVVAAFSAIAMVTTGRSFGRRLLRVIEEL